MASVVAAARSRTVVDSHPAAMAGVLRPSVGQLLSLILSLVPSFSGRYLLYISDQTIHICGMGRSFRILPCGAYRRHRVGAGRVLLVLQHGPRWTAPLRDTTTETDGEPSERAECRRRESCAGIKRRCHRFESSSDKKVLSACHVEMMRGYNQASAVAKALVYLSLRRKSRQLERFPAKGPRKESIGSRMRWVGCQPHSSLLSERTDGTGKRDTTH